MELRGFFQCEILFLLCTRVHYKLVLCRVRLLRLAVAVVVDHVHNLVVFADVWDDLDVETLLVEMHILHDVLHSEAYGLLDLLEVLHFFELAVRKLVLGRAEQAFVTQQFLPFFLGNDFLGRLLRGVESERGRVESERVKELLSPVSWVQVEFETLLSLCLPLVCLVFAISVFFILRCQTLLLLLDHRIHFVAR